MRWIGLVGLVVLGCGGADGEPVDDATDEEALASGGYAGTYNNPGQGHADVCVKLKGTSAKLRYPDFSETGFEVTNALKFQPGDPGICKNGEVRLDAREILDTKEGRLLFHRGGFGYEDAGDVKYGHLWLADIASHVTPEKSPAGNGKSCTAKGAPYKIRVKSIPPDMHYKKLTGSGQISYVGYGDPAHDQGSPTNVHYTYLSWSWINVAGGGVVRSLLKDGDVFHRCDVPSIKLTSVDANGRANGWVRAIYGKTAQGEQWVEGWTVHSHKMNGDPAVTYHVE